MRVAIVIPVLNAEGYVPDLFEAFRNQNPSRPNAIILVDSQSTDATVSRAANYENARVIPIDDFSHGRSRNMGAQVSDADIIVFLSQDALPDGESWLSELVKPFEDDRVAAAYSRQIPRDDASPMERFFIQTRFPDGAPLRREKGAKASLCLEDVFFSNVSAAVRRDLLLKYPFDETLIMSEDQQLSRDLIEAGYTVVYQPGSRVIHSHRYRLKDVFQRYFDSVYSLTLIFPKHGLGTSISMGFRYLWTETVYVAQTKPLWLPYYFLYTLAKTSGTIASHFAERMPRWLLRRVSLHAYHWK